MPLTRVRRQILIATLVVVAIGLAWLWGRPLQDQRFYAFLEQYQMARQVVRPLFVLVGKRKEFDLQIARAELQRVCAELMADPDIPVNQSQ